ncbi:MAG TPA: MFS transporter, partial [Phenylobacterium sp.]|nr:MFS transporter [Phenylobacterium sp.]
LATGASVAAGRLGSVAGPLVAGQLLGLGFTAGGVAAAMAPVAIVAGLAATLMTLTAKIGPE